jgi:hypothetical protein
MVQSSLTVLVVTSFFMTNDLLEKAKERITPPEQGPLDKGDEAEPAHDNPEPLLPIGDE